MKYVLMLLLLVLVPTIPAPLSAPGGTNPPPKEGGHLYGPVDPTPVCHLKKC